MIFYNCVWNNIYWEKQGMHSHKIYIAIIIIIIAVDSMCV